MATTFGKYTLKEELGRGGMGAVYRAHDAQLRRDVALKVMPKEHCQDPVTVERFVREARALAHLQHPNLTAIYDVGEENGRYFFAMELVVVVVGGGGGGGDDGDGDDDDDDADDDDGGDDGGGGGR